MVTFSKADTVVIMSECGLEVVGMLEKVKANRLYIEYEGHEGVGLAGDSIKMLPFPKIRINLTKSALIGGYMGMFRCLCNP